MNEDVKKALVIVTIVGLIIVGIVLAVILCPECFEPQPPEEPDETPTDYLYLEMEFDEHGFWDAGDVIEIFFKDDNKFKFHDKFYSSVSDKDVFKGDYEWEKDKHGRGDLKLEFDSRRPEYFDIELKKDGVFEGEIDDEDNGGKYRWLNSIPVPTNHLLITIRKSYNIIFQDGHKFTRDDSDGEYYYEENKYSEGDKLLIMHYDGVGNCDWYITFQNSTHFTMTGCPSYHYSGRYEWI